MWPQPHFLLFLPCTHNSNNTEWLATLQTHHAISSFCTTEWAVLSAYKFPSLLTDKYTPKSTKWQLKYTFSSKGLPQLSQTGRGTSSYGDPWHHTHTNTNKDYRTTVYGNCLCLFYFFTRSFEKRQSHCWAYTPRKPELKETHVPQCSSQHCL